MKEYVLIKRVERCRQAPHTGGVSDDCIITYALAKTPRRRDTDRGRPHV